MALGNNEFKGGSLVFLSPRCQDEDKKPVTPHFVVSRVEDKKIVQQAETFSVVSGNLSKIEIKERTSKKTGDVNKHVLVYLRDDSSSETYLIDFTFKMATRSLFNALLNLETFDNLNLSYYETKKQFDAYYLKQNDVRVDWKYKLEELPEPKKVEFKKKIRNDYTEQDELFEKELLELAGRLSGKVETVVQEVSKSNVPVGTNNDVPF